MTTHKESVSEDYHWFREYQYNLHHDRSGALRTLCLFFDEKGRTVEYVDLKSKLLLRKRSKRASDHLAVPDIRPCGSQSNEPCQIQMTLDAGKKLDVHLL